MSDKKLINYQMMALAVKRSEREKKVREQARAVVVGFRAGNTVACFMTRR